MIEKELPAAPKTEDQRQDTPPQVPVQGMNFPVMCQYGGHVERLPVGGRTVEYVRNNLEKMWQMPKGSKVSVNGNPVDEDYVIDKQDCQVVFVKSAAQKG